MHTRITELFGIEYPIIQGGLAHLAFAGLCAAVSNAGGLGQITAASFATPEELRAEIARARGLTDRPFAVNFALGHHSLDDLLEVALEERVAAISITAGNPAAYLKRAQEAGVKTFVLVAGVRQAQKCEELGADAVIGVGAEGGGHLGREDTGTNVLIRRLVETVGIPVVASGGLGDGYGLAAMLALGAEGIEMGTRFVATQECIAHPTYKAALVAASELDTTVIERSIGRPARVLRSPWTDHIAAVEASGVATLEDFLPLFSVERNRRAAVGGHLDEGLVWAGQVAGLIHDVPTVAELFARLVAEARAASLRLAAQW